jgi:hypothetical protein
MTLGRDQSRIGTNARTDRPHNLLPNCLGRCSFCAPACRHACQLSETKNDGSTGSARERHGLFRCGAFQAARIRRPSIQYSRVVLPPGPNSWPLNIQPLVQFQPAPRLSAGPIRIVQECGALATYRRASCLSASTICRYITAIGRTIGEEGLNPGHIAGRISWSAAGCFTDSGALS